MQSTLRTIRAVAALFAWRLYLPVAIFAGIMAFILIVLMSWLVTTDLWWLLLAIPVLLIVLVAVTVLAVIGVIIRLVAPSQSKAQKASVAAFVDKLQRLSEVTMTPKFVLLFRTVKDVVAPSKAGFIESVVDDTVSLKKDFQELQRGFHD